VVTPFFNGAYVPGGTSALVRVTVWASPPAPCSRLCVSLEWQDDPAQAGGVVHSGCVGSVCMTVSNLSVIGMIESSELTTAAMAAFSWIERIITPLDWAGTLSVIWDDDRAKQVWTEFAKALQSPTLIERAA